LIVDHDIIQNPTDQSQLGHMAKRVKETLQVEEMHILTDRGYHDGEEVKACLDEGITPYVPEPKTSVNEKCTSTRAPFGPVHSTRKASMLALLKANTGGGDSNGIGPASTPRRE
jgi:hypothetical protein